MELKVFPFVLILFTESLSSVGEKNGVKISNDITKCKDKLLNFINNNLPNDIYQILKKVSENNLKDVHETLEDRENLRFLILAHHNGFTAITAMLMDLEEGLNEAADSVYQAAAIKRGDLDISNLIYPFEFYGHKCGFSRGVNI